MTDAAPPDAAARARALEPGGSFIVQAPAGSGKTTLLTQRYLTLLARASRPEAVIAITFTKKAAAEMRARVLEALAAASEGRPPKDAADVETLARAAAALARGEAGGWALRTQPSRLRIQTFDALNLSLAERLPILSRAGSSLEVEPEPAALYAAAAARTLEAVDEGGPFADALAVVLDHVDNETGRLAELIARMLSARDRWLRVVVGAAHAARRAELRALLDEALASLVAEQLEHARALVPAALAPRLVAVLARAAGRLAPDHPEFAALAAATGGLAARAADLPLWGGITRILLTARGTWRQRLTKNEGLPPEAKADKDDVQGLLEHLARVPGLEAALAAVGALPPAQYPDGLWRAVEALTDVLIQSAGRLEALFAERGRVDFIAVAQAALAALGTPEDPTDLTLALDGRIEHLLVDEFQDTSATQVELLERLTAGWSAGDGRTLFLVGDPMQSIYGFREANVGLFLRIRAEGLGAIALEPLTLEANFRSRPALVDWFNRAFADVLPAEEDVARGAVRYAPSRAVRPASADTGVTLHVLPGAGPDAEAARVLEIVRRERALAPTAKIAVLGRARTQLEPVATLLGEAGIRYQGVKLVPLAERLAVRDLVSLTRAVLHLGDRIAWLACLRAPWCGLDSAALAVLAGDDEVIWQAIADPARLAGLEPAARARLLRTREVLARALAERGRRSLAATIEATWIALGGPATLADAADLPNAESYFVRLAALERGADLDDPAGLADALVDLYAAPDPEADERLQLLTVHGAKGLEWDVVIVTGLGRGNRGSERRLLEWLEFARAGRGPGLVLAPHRARSAEHEPIEAWLRQLRRDREHLELGRLVYVAATRAEERLHLVCHAESDAGGAVRPPRDGSLLATLWPAIGPEVEGLAAAATAAGAGSAAPVRDPAARVRLYRLADDWQAPAARRPVVPIDEPPTPTGPSEFEFEWVTAAARHVGTVVHEELERIGRRGLVPADGFAARDGAWRRRLAELGVGPGQIAGAAARVERALTGIASDARGAWLFDPAHRAESELDLSTARGGRVTAARIDRTFVDADGVRWIVDFKTSEHEGTDLEAFLDREQARYAPQLEHYAALMRAREPGRTIRLGLYFPLHGGWREWASGEHPAEATSPS